MYILISAVAVIPEGDPGKLCGLTKQCALLFNYLPSDLWWKVLSLVPLLFLAVIAVLVLVGVVWYICTKSDLKGYIIF